jgi:SPP1 gp7 family putative phage head morphogenesis protein
MATSRTFLQDASTRHAIFVSRFAGGQLKQILPYLERARKVAAAELAGRNLSDLSRKRLNQIYTDIDGQLKVIYDKMGKKLKANLKPFANYEADFSATMLSKGTSVNFTTPAKNQIQAAVFSDPLLFLNDDKISIDDALEDFGDKKRKQIITAIKDGVIVGKTTDDIIRNVTFVTNKIQRNHAEALVRTVTSHISAVARDIVIKENDDVVSHEEWVSTLDSATTPQCQALDGQTFEKGSGPYPPIHWGCRSTRIPIVKEEYTIKSSDPISRPSVGPDGAEGVPSSTTYNSWLKRQPDSFQDEVLGPQKAQLFREGGLNVRDFVDDKLNPLTLKELREKEPMAFEKAGLNK